MLCIGNKLETTVGCAGRCAVCARDVCNVLGAELCAEPIMWGLIRKGMKPGMRVRVSESECRICFSYIYVPRYCTIMCEVSLR